MNKRLVMVLLSMTVITTSSGCAPFRNFFFGRGAKCGLCTRITAPFQKSAPLAAPAAAPCQTPTYVQPLPQPCAPAPQCGCGPGTYQGYGPAVPGTTGSMYAPDPYMNNVVPNQPIYGDSFVPRTLDYQSNYPSQGYKLDKNGDRIIYEEPLPPGAVSN
ncbi:MAG: hypothetical protein AAFV88_00325 [Planctomycetota bacterium]